MFTSVYPSELSSFTFSQLFICIVASLVLGLLVAFVHTIHNTYNMNFIVTVAILPVLVQSVIMLVNGNLGTGMAVLGAFSLVRFRSVAGGAREITSIFWSMAIGLATGMGYVGFIVIISIMISVFLILFYQIIEKKQLNQEELLLKISIPENLNQLGLFDDVFKEYLKTMDLISVKTTTMGSLYELRYRIRLNASGTENQLIDEIRVRNGNLPVMLGQMPTNRDSL